jgi:hypothetical protein
VGQISTGVDNAAHLPFRHADSAHTYTGHTANAADVDLQARSFFAPRQHRPSCCLALTSISVPL